MKRRSEEYKWGSPNQSHTFSSFQVQTLVLQSSHQQAQHDSEQACVCVCALVCCLWVSCDREQEIAFFAFTFTLSLRFLQRVCIVPPWSYRMLIIEFLMWGLKNSHLIYLFINMQINSYKPINSHNMVEIVNSGSKRHTSQIDHLAQLIKIDK